MPNHDDDSADIPAGHTAAEMRTDLDQLISFGKIATWVAGIFALPVVIAALMLWKNDGRQDDRLARLEDAQNRAAVDSGKIIDRLDAIKTSIGEVKERVIRLEAGK